MLPFALPPNLKIGHFQLFIKDVEVERLIAASNASGKPHCDFAFPPLLVGNAKCLLGKPQTPMKRRINPAAVHVNLFLDNLNLNKLCIHTTVIQNELHLILSALRKNHLKASKFKLEYYNPKQLIF